MTPGSSPGSISPGSTKPPSLSLHRHVLTTDDGRNLEYFAAGQGQNLVVMESGLGMGAHYWLPVIDELAPHCRVVAYNRSGYGASAPDEAQRTLGRLAEDLRTVIAAQEYARLVLVGHSWGGPIVRVAAASHLKGLEGVVLVDPSDEHLLGEYRPSLLRLQGAVMPPLARLGLLGVMIRPILKGLPATVQRTALAETTTLNAAREAAAELRVFLPELRRLGEAPQYSKAPQYGAAPHCEDLPVFLLSGGGTMRGESRVIRAKIRRAHVQAAQKLGARLVSAEASGHNIPITEPGVVARAAREFLGV